MPVTKFKSVSDMPRPSRADGADLIERIDAVWSRAFELLPPEFPRGVMRFRSIDDANRARAASVAERMRRRAR